MASHYNLVSYGSDTERTKPLHPPRISNFSSPLPQVIDVSMLLKAISASQLLYIEVRKTLRFTKVLLAPGN